MTAQTRPHSPKARMKDRSTACALADTPDVVLGVQMGWLSWERWRCFVNCEKDPANCLSERLVLETAERVVQDGYLAAGYEYINIGHTSHHANHQPPNIHHCHCHCVPRSPSLQLLQLTAQVWVTRRLLVQCLRAADPSGWVLWRVPRRRRAAAAGQVAIPARHEIHRGQAARHGTQVRAVYLGPP